ncbi:hypothetical protein BDY24DRAFT_279966 [Mrakia frigida]|uniref:uncharacterized protein n=1 Tax=Mrakia frigida TaxID=29902 RepID=UPI003FCC0FAE
MAFTLDSLTPWVTLSLFVLPLLLPRLPPLINFIQRQLNPSSVPRPPTRPVQPLPHSVLLILLLHTLYHAKNLLFRPPNIFLQTGLPLLSTPVSRIHQVLLRLVASHSSSSSSPFDLGTQHLPTQTLHLLSKLQSYDARILYARFGQSTFLSCTWCSSLDSSSSLDWFVYWLVGAAAQYLAEVVVWAVLVELSGRRERWRGKGVWALVAMAVGEGGWVWLGQIEMGRGQGWMLHSSLHLYRSLLLLLLPLLLPLLPTNPPTVPSQLDTTLPSLLPKMDTLLTHLKLIELSRIASVRNPTLREAVVAAGERMKKDTDVGREDEGVVKEAERVGLTGEEGVKGGLREGARGFLGVARGRMEGSLSGRS